jgi:hypothetical protein
MATESCQGCADWVTRDRQTHLSCRSTSTLRRNVGSCNSGSEVVTMVQPAESGNRSNPWTCTGLFLWLTASRRSLRQCEMRPVVMIVTDVLFHESSQMAFIQHDHMIEQISSTTADPALSNAVLPRASEAGSLWLDIKTLQCADHFATEVRGAIKDHVGGC